MSLYGGLDILHLWGAFELFVHDSQLMDAFAGSQRPL